MPQDEVDTFQHYRILRRDGGSLWRLGAGAMGVTYKAVDTNLDAPVALKVINALHTGSDAARERFRREARAAASLRHRNVAGIHHLGQDGDTFFYAMEFVDGETLEHFVRREGPQSWRLALPAMLQVARALMAAHEKNLVHRDIKPANIMLVREAGEDEPTIKLIDFGLAKSLVEENGSVASLTGSGFLGTPLYASPEQCDEQAPDIRSDIYSLGVTLWFVLAGRVPFMGGLGKVFAQHLHAPPPWTQLPADLPEPLRTLLARMLAKDRADRPQTPADLRREIETCLRACGEGVHTGAASDVPAPPPADVPAPPPALPTVPIPRAQAGDVPPTVAPAAVAGLPAASFRLREGLRRAGGRFSPQVVANLLGPLARIADAAEGIPFDLTPDGVWIVPDEHWTSAGAIPPNAARISEDLLTGARHGWVIVAVLEDAKSAAVAAPVTALAALAYEMLGGTPPVRRPEYRPLTQCSEETNTALRLALTGDDNGSGAFAATLFAITLATMLRGKRGTRTPGEPGVSLPTPLPASPSPPVPGVRASPGQRTTNRSDNVFARGLRGITRFLRPWRGE